MRMLMSNVDVHTCSHWCCQACMPQEVGCSSHDSTSQESDILRANRAASQILKTYGSAAGTRGHACCLKAAAA